MKEFVKIPTMICGAIISLNKALQEFIKNFSDFGEEMVRQKERLKTEELHRKYGYTPKDMSAGEIKNVTKALLNERLRKKTMRDASTHRGRLF